MTEGKPIEPPGPVTRQVEVHIGNLAHHLLSISDYTTSAQIAAELITAIRILVDVRRSVH